MCVAWAGKRKRGSPPSSSLRCGIVSDINFRCSHAFVRRRSTALAYEAIYQRPVRELFAGLYQQAERDVVARAKTLTHRLDRGDSPRRSLRRRQVFAEIAALRSPKPITNENNEPN
jgi:hypothetical protein